MTSRVGLRVGLVVLLAMTTACAENIDPEAPTTPSGPSSLSPFLVPQIGGLWGGRLTLTGVAAGAGSARNAADFECVASAFRSTIGETVEHTLSIQQSGTELTGRLVSAGTGVSCSYTGTVGTGTAVLAASTCGTPRQAFRCPPDSSGVVFSRGLDLVASSVTATFDPPGNVTTMSGTASHSYNIINEDDELVGTVVTNHRFTSLTRR